MLLLISHVYQVDQKINSKPSTRWMQTFAKQIETYSHSIVEV